MSNIFHSVAANTLPRLCVPLGVRIAGEIFALTSTLAALVTGLAYALDRWLP